MKRCMKMCNTSIILKHPLLFTSVFLQVHQAGFSQAHQLVVPCSLTPGVHIYIVCKHLKKNLFYYLCVKWPLALLQLLNWCLASLKNHTMQKINQGWGIGNYIELHKRSSHQHKKVQLLYGYAFIHRWTYPHLACVSRPRSFLKLYLFNI